MKTSKHILSYFIIICLLLSITGCSKTNISNNIKSSSTETNYNNNIVVTKAYDFSDGFAWTVYKKDDVEYCGLIDTSGKIIYSNKYLNDSYYRFYRMSGSLTYFSCDGAYTVINSKGDVVMSSENGDFDEVLAAGDNLALVYKYNGGLTTDEHLYGVIDSNGNWIQPLTDWKNKYHGTGCSNYSYVGSGMFVAQIAANLFIYNSKDNSGIILRDINCNYSEMWSSSQNFDTQYNFNIINNVAFFTPDSIGELSYSDNISICGINNIDDDKIIKIPESFALKTNGQYDIIPEFKQATKDKLLFENNGYIDILDYTKNLTSTISDYPSSMIKAIQFNGERGLLLLSGQDRKEYFTLIDENGKKQFEPINYIGSTISKYTRLYYSFGKIVACIEEGIYNIYDENGIVLSEGLEYSTIDGFYEDIAVAVDKDGNSCYINSKGEKILTNLIE